jgi:hypothetical protein
MPSDFGAVVTAVTAFAETYGVFVTAGLILGLGAWLLRKLVKTGR